MSQLWLRQPPDEVHVIDFAVDLWDHGDMHKIGALQQECSSNLSSRQASIASTLERQAPKPKSDGFSGRNGEVIGRLRLEDGIQAL